MTVHVVRAIGEFAESRLSQRERNRQPDRRPERIATANPVPHREATVFGNPEAVRGVNVCGHRDEMLPHRLGISGAFEQPASGIAGVGHGLQRLEGLRRDDDQCFVGVEVHERSDRRRSVHVREKANLQISAERSHDEFRSEAGASDADVHDGGERLARRPAQVTVSYAICEIEHSFLFGFNQFRHRFRSFVAGRANCGMQGGPTLRCVDDAALEQVFDGVLQPTFVGKGEERLDDLVVHALPGKVHEQSAGAETHRSGTRPGNTTFLR